MGLEIQKDFLELGFYLNSEIRKIELSWIFCFLRENGIYSDEYYEFMVSPLKPANEIESFWVFSFLSIGISLTFLHPFIPFLEFHSTRNGGLPYLLQNNPIHFEFQMTGPNRKCLSIPNASKWIEFELIFLVWTEEPFCKVGKTNFSL